MCSCCDFELAFGDYNSALFVWHKHSTKCYHNLDPSKSKHLYPFPGILLPLTQWKEENDALFGMWTICESREGTETVASRAPIPLCLSLQDPEALLTWAFQGHGCGHGV